MTTLTRLVIVTAAIVAIVCLLFPVQPVNAADDSSAQVSKLLSQAKTKAFELKEDASELWLFTQVPPTANSATEISEETHSEALKRISADVGAMTVELAKLESARKNAAPWQQGAIDEIKPLVKELVNSTQAVVEYFNKRPNQTRTEEYKDYVEANADRADQLATLISVFVDYGKTKDRLERLGTKLGMPGASK